MMTTPKNNLYTMGSLFSGSGGFELCSIMNGITPLWNSEINPFPMLVTEKNLPDTRQLGNISEVNGGDITPVDVITFGSPCFPAGTPVLTDKGYRPIEYIKPGDMVLTDQNRFRAVNRIGGTPEQELYEIEAQGILPVQATANHPFIVRTMCDAELSNPYQKPLYAITENDYIGVPILNTAENPYGLSKEDCYKLGNYICQKYNLYYEKPINCDFLYDDLSDTAKKFANYEKIPMEILNLPRNHIKSFIEGYFGLRNYSKHSIFCKTTDIEFAINMCLAIQKAFQTGCYICRSKLFSQGTYIVSFNPASTKGNSFVKIGDFIWYPVYGVKKLDVVTDVFNLEVDEDHTYVAQNCVVHNCQDLSQAGKREGLDGSRSCLFYDAVRIIKEMRHKTNGEYPKYIVWENVCFPAGTFVTTEKGYVPIEEIQVNDKVKTLSGKYMPVKKVYETKEQEVICVEATGSEPVVCTPNHPFLIRKREVHSSHTPYKNSFSSPKWVKASEINNEDLVGYVLDKGAEFPDMLISEEQAWAVGRWLADGSVDTTKSSPRIFISCGNKKIDSTLEKLKNLPYEIHINKPHPTAVNFCFASKDFYRLIESAGRGAGNKSVPPYVFNLPLKLQKAVLEGYISGDGYIRTRGNRTEFAASTASRKLAYGISRLVRNCYQVGCSINKKPAKDNVIDGRVLHGNYPVYNIYASLTNKKSLSFVENGILWQPVRAVKQLDKKETVYNLSVEEDNTYEVNNIIVHNCGALTSHKGNDFRIVLEEIAKIKDEAATVPIPESGKWCGAGKILGNNYSVAWRTLDAEWWGVPHRRRRIFLVADLDGGSAGELLFEFEGLSGYSPQSCHSTNPLGNSSYRGTSRNDCELGGDGRNDRKVSGDTKDYKNRGVSDSNGINPRDIQPLSEAASTLRSSAGMPKHSADIHGRLVVETIGFCQNNSATAGNLSQIADAAPPLSCTKRGAALISFGFDAYNSKATEEVSGTLGVNCGMSTGRSTVLCINDQGGNSLSVEKGEASPTLRAQAHSNIPIIAKEDKHYCLQGSMIGRKEENGPQGNGINEEVSFTLNTLDRHAVTQKRIVRRFTPLECGRLQGFPDYWCENLAIKNPTEKQIDYWWNVWENYRQITGAYKKVKSKKQIKEWLENPTKSDEPSYIMWGNGVAVPCVAFIMAAVRWGLDRKYN